MALENYQYIIQPNTLYQLKVLALSMNEKLRYSLEVKGGLVDIYGTYDEQPLTPPNDMSIDYVGFEGIDSFNNVPTYIYISGSPTKIILTGIKPTLIT